MELLKIKEKDLELTVSDTEVETYTPIMGGMPECLGWDGYVDKFKDEYRPYFELIKKAVIELEWVGVKADQVANDTYFSFSDGEIFGFSWRAWGDLMSAIVGKKEGYMAYYM